MKTIQKRTENSDMHLRIVQCNDGTIVTGSTITACVEDYVRKTIQRFEDYIAKDSARIVEAKQEIEELTENIRTAKNLITDFELWLDWEKYPPEKSYEIITSPRPF